ncbi:MAG TPA: FtsX-like permease family protein [Candidatus Babeliales bacterium]|nr:FtsX-like permease family protein [Candidatus Babeliales bacterium]
MNMIAFFLARRILFTHPYHKNISIMTSICFIGIFIGSFSLALITAIMNGFEVVIHEKMQGVHSNIIMETHNNDINIEVLTHILRKEFPEIISLSPMASHHVLLHANNDASDTTPIIAIIKGINPETEQYTTTLANKIIANPHAMTFPQLFNDNQLIIGKELAHNNNIAIGDTIELLYMRNEQIKRNKVILDSQTAVISGIFDTGIDEFDNSVMYCSLSFLEELFPNMEIEQINIALSPIADEAVIIRKLHNRLGINVYSWKKLYPSLVATLKLEKYVSFFILALILLVASMNIISLLFMQITQKRSDIALMRAIGMSHQSISLIFFIIGLIISCMASFFGLLAAVLVSLLLKHYPFITLPDSYYVNQLPVAMTLEIVCAVFCLVIILSTCATLLPIRRIRNINISHVLRFEG